MSKYDHIDQRPILHMYFISENASFLC